MNITRRHFLRSSSLALGAVAVAASNSPLAKSAEKNSASMIQTVLGLIPASALGFTLPHEHVICDFIGARETGQHRWEVDAVVARMRPILAQLKERGVTGFADCTPAYIGRDPRILAQLAKATGLHILTNTGYYGGAGDKFVPTHAYVESADQLAWRWIREARDGIEGTGVKPGFMKIGIDEAKEGRLSEIDEKLVRASARASRQTGLAVVCHTGGGPSGLAATKIFIAEKAAPDRFVVAHSDGHGLDTNKAVADLGAWVSFDGIGPGGLPEHLKRVAAMLERHSERLLLSHDSGWYSVGEPNGGKEIRNFNFIPETFLPALRQAGASDALVRRLTMENPAKVFAIAKLS